MKYPDIVVAREAHGSVPLTVDELLAARVCDKELVLAQSRQFCDLKVVEIW